MGARKPCRASDARLRPHGILRGMRSYRGMSPLTTATVAVVDRLRVPVEQMTEEQRHEARARTYPTRPPHSWVTGRADPAVGITFGTAPARDGYEIPLRIYRPRAIRDAQNDVPGHRLVPRRRLGSRQRRQLRPALHPPRGRGRGRGRERRLPAGPRAPVAHGASTTRSTRRRGSRPSPTCSGPMRTDWRSAATPPAGTSPRSSRRSSTAAAPTGSATRRSSIRPPT